MIYVTGATGHIGNNVVRELLHRQIAVTALVRRTSPALEGMPKVLVGDLFDRKWLEGLLKQGDVLIHSAGVIDFSRKDRKESERVNVELTRSILDVCEARQVRLVFVSSVDAIAKPKHGGVIRVPSTADLTGVKSHYSMAKAVSARMVSERLDAFTLQGAIVYPAAVVGPHDYKPSRAGAELKDILKQNVVFDLKGGYNFVDVRDVALAIATVALDGLTGHFILGAHEKTIREFYQTIQNVSGHRLRIVGVPVWLAKLGSVFFRRYTPVMIDAVLENHAYDTSPMSALLKRDPIPFEQTVADTIDWFRDFA